MATKDPIIVNDILMNFIKEMQNWELFCNEVDEIEELTFEEKFLKQKASAKEIFDKYCTVKERKNDRPNVISYGANGAYEYDVNEEKIIEVTQENENKILVYTQGAD
jgi:hypothetical protein